VSLSSWPINGAVLVDRPTAVRLPLEEGETPPPEPITEAEIREELRIALDDEAHRIETNAIAAREWIETTYGLALIPGRHQCIVTTRYGRLDLPIHPVTEVLSVSRRSVGGVLDAPLLELSDYWVDLDYRPARIWVGSPGECGGTYVVICATGWTTVTIPLTVKGAIAYRVWGNLDGIAVADWKREIDIRIRPYAVRGL
jgi:uncharacterized phiE125 gp8 family phage protein